MQKIATTIGIIGFIIFSLVLLFARGENSNLTDFARGFLTGISIVFLVAFVIYLGTRLVRKKE
jgi:Kef-type K+ transport system membrane component KefB